MPDQFLPHEWTPLQELLRPDYRSPNADDLERWVASDPAPPKTLFLVHGEPEASQALAWRLATRGLQALAPELDEAFEREGPGTWRSLSR